MTNAQERKAQERQARRRRIQEAARSVFSERGYAGASIELIARAAQLSVGAIYLYFRSKEDLYVSLIEDARRDVDPAVHAAVLKRYLDESGIADRAAFLTGFQLAGAQRHARIIGLFVRLLRRDGKPVYLPHLPRVWRMFERSLTHEALAPLRQWIDTHLPPALRRIGAA